MPRTALPRSTILTDNRIKAASLIHGIDGCSCCTFGFFKVRVVHPIFGDEFELVLYRRLIANEE